MFLYHIPKVVIVLLDVYARLCLFYVDSIEFIFLYRDTLSILIINKKKIETNRNQLCLVLLIVIIKDPRPLYLH